MKKLNLITLMIFVSAFTYAQKKELKLAESALKKSNYAEAKTALNQVAPLLASLPEKSKSNYYLMLAQSLFANGEGSIADIKEAVSSLANIKGNDPAAKDLKAQMVNTILNSGNKFYEAKDFSKASEYFEEAYRLSPKDTTYLYYAAATSVNEQQYDRSLKLYNELKGLGYTGIKTDYLATNKETNKEESFESKDQRDLAIKLKTHISPKEVKLESKKPEIVKNIALIYVANGEDEKALQAMADARSESPNDVNLILTEANVHYKMGHKEEFKKLLEQATSLDPQNPELQYNLGVISSESGNTEEAKAYYEKAIALDPKYANAYINLSALILSKEDGLIKEMNGLGNTSKDNLRYEQLKKQREELYKQAIPNLEKALEVDSKNLSAAKTLFNIYSSLGDTNNAKLIKAKVDAIESGN